MSPISSRQPDKTRKKHNNMSHASTGNKHDPNPACYNGSDLKRPDLIKLVDCAMVRLKVFMLQFASATTLESKVGILPGQHSGSDL